MTRTPQDIAQDLVFSVNGTLSAADQAALDSVLQQDASLRAEHDALAAIRARMQAEEIRSPGEFGLARLMRDVQRDSAVPTARKPRTWIWQLAAGVACAALLGQTLLGPSPEATGYQLAGAAASADLVVSFVPDAAESQIRALLVGLGLEIVAGPSAIGFYELKVLNQDEMDAVASALRDAVETVESVENAQD